jgi:hypothetical protein
MGVTTIHSADGTIIIPGGPGATVAPIPWAETGLSAPKIEQPRFFIRPASMAFEPREPVKYIVEGITRAGSLNCIYGDPGSAKTYTGLVKAVCIATGKPYLGRETIQSPVLIIDEESGRNRFLDRLKEIMLGMGADELTPLFWVSMANFMPANVKDREAIQNEIVDMGIGYVLIDALSEIMDGDENSKKDVHPVMYALKQIVDNTGTSIDVIHHSNRGSNGYRGSSVILGDVDTMTRVKKESGSRLISFEFEKNRDGDTFTWAAFATWEDGIFRLEQADSDAPKMNKAQVFILDYLTNHGEVPYPEIEKQGFINGIANDTIKKAKDKLRENGVIERTNPFALGRGVQAIWKLKEGQNER